MTGCEKIFFTPPVDMWITLGINARNVAPGAFSGFSTAVGVFHRKLSTGVDNYVDKPIPWGFPACGMDRDPVENSFSFFGENGGPVPRTGTGITGNCKNHVKMTGNVALCNISGHLRNSRIRASISLSSSGSFSRSRWIFSMAWITVLWSRPPKHSPIFFRDSPAISFVR
jgi:hypothetical protein